MSKKQSNVFFNIFNVEDDFEEETIAVEESDKNGEQFFSIAEIPDKPMKPDELSGQLTMFAEEILENANESEIPKKEPISEEITIIQEPVEDIPAELVGDFSNNFFVEEVVSKEINEEIVEEEPIEEEPIAEEIAKEEPVDEEPVAEEIAEEEPIEETKQSEEEEMLVSLLETNVLDQEIAEEIIEDDIEAKESTSNDIYSNIPDYKAIKKQKIFDEFETPYVYHGKNGDRIRYRLSLPTDNDVKRNRAKKAVSGWIITIALALLLAIFIRMFVFVVATVDGPSMRPTLATQDRLFVTKYTYTFTDIKRGDIVICRYNTVAYPDMYVKRVIGLPGETISIMDGIVYINGTELKEDYTIPSTPSDRYYNMDAVYIPTGYVFVMGDNRNNSADSRMESIGAISADNIIGKAQARIFPFSSMCILEEDN